MLVLRHGGRLRATLKSTAEEPAVLFAIAHARKDLESLAVHMPNLPDTDARTLALRMFYIEVSNGMSAGDAEINVSQMFMVSPITVRRWVTLWKNTREEALHNDH